FWCTQLEIAASPSACQKTPVKRDVGALISGAGGGYIEIKAATPSAIGSNRSIWMQQELSLMQSNDYTAISYPYGKGCEFDFFENTPSTATSNSHEWVGPTTSGWANLTQNNGVVDGNLHTYGFLWIPTTKGGGTGTITRYLDGVQYATLSYSAGSSPTASPGSWSSGTAAGSLMGCESTNPLMGFNIILTANATTGE